MTWPAAAPYAETASCLPWSDTLSGPFNAGALQIIRTDVAPAHVLYALNASWGSLCKTPNAVRGHAVGPPHLSRLTCDCLGFEL